MALAPSVVWIDEVDTVFKSGKVKGATGEPPNRISKHLTAVLNPKKGQGLIDPEDLEVLFGAGPVGYPVEPADGSIVRAPGVGLQPDHPLAHRPYVDPVTRQEHGPWAYHAEPCAFLVDDDVFV